MEPPHRHSRRVQRRGHRTEPPLLCRRRRTSPLDGSVPRLCDAAEREAALRPRPVAAEGRVRLSFRTRRILRSRFVESDGNDQLRLFRPDPFYRPTIRQFAQEERLICAIPGGTRRYEPPGQVNAVSVSEDASRAIAHATATNVAHDPCFTRCEVECLFCASGMFEARAVFVEPTSRENREVRASNRLAG